MKIKYEKYYVEADVIEVLLDNFNNKNSIKLNIRKAYFKIIDVKIMSINSFILLIKEIQLFFQKG